MKRILALMLAMLTVCLAFAACSDQEKEETGDNIDLTVTTNDSVFNTENEHQDRFYYEYINGDEVIITDYAGSHVPHAITVPDKIDERPVTAIGDSAFMSKTNITEVTLPATVNTIGTAAFAKCSNLAKINVPDGTVSIGDAAFSESAITEITLPDTVTLLGKAVFFKCTALTKAKFPAGKVQDNSTDPVTETTVNVIPEQMFANCTALREINCTIPVDRIDAFAFANCKELTNVPTLSDTALSVGEFAFLGCAKITAMAIPATVEKIGESAFYGCDALAAVTFADTVSVWMIDYADQYREDAEMPASADSAVNASNLKTTYAACTWTRKTAA